MTLNVRIAFLFFLLPSLGFSQVETSFVNGGAVRIGDSSTTCDGTIEGALRFDADGADTIDYCNGSVWLTLLTSSLNISLSDADGDTLIQVEETGDEDIIRFDTAGAERMVIDASGNVGIGTATPTHSLHVDGTFNFTTGGNLKVRMNSADMYQTGGFAIKLNGAGDASEPTYKFQADTDTGIFTSAADTLNFGTGGSEAMRIDSSGNVGLGTTAPATTLDINGAESMRGMAAPALSPAGQGRIYFDSTSNTYKVSENGGAYTDLVGAGGGSGDFLADGTVPMIGQLQAFAGSELAPGITFDGDEDTGFVNHVAGQMRWSSNGSYAWGFSSTSIYSDANGGPLMSNFSTAAMPSFSWNGDNDNGMFSPTTDTVAFSTAGTERLRLGATGNVGVGSTTPRAKLDVAGAITSGPAVAESGGNVDFVGSNFAYTASSCGAFNLYSMKDGASYTLAIQGTVSATCAFTAYPGPSGSPGTAHSVKLPPSHGATTATYETLYSFVVIGTTVYVSWVPGY